VKNFIIFSTLTLLFIFRRLTAITQQKSQNLLKEIKLLSQSLNKLSTASTSDTTVINDMDYEDMEHLVTGLKQLVLMSDHSERIRLLTICPSTWSRREIANHFFVSQWEGRMAIELRESSGLLSFYENNQDRGQLTPTTIKTVLDFYEGKCKSISLIILNSFII
jgi:hypothetical protein